MKCKLLLILLSILLTGCILPPRVYMSNYTKAIELCKNNDGVNHIIFYKRVMTVVCKNGMNTTIGRNNNDD